jgi:hypothetical protein
LASVGDTLTNMSVLALPPSESLMSIVSLWFLQANDTNKGCRLMVYLTPKIERIISLLSTSPEGEVRCRCQNGMAYKD